MEQNETFAATPTTDVIVRIRHRSDAHRPGAHGHPRQVRRHCAALATLPERHRRTRRSPGREMGSSGPQRPDPTGRGCVERSAASAGVGERDWAEAEPSTGRAFASASAAVVPPACWNRRPRGKPRMLPRRGADQTGSMLSDEESCACSSRWSVPFPGGPRTCLHPARQHGGRPARRHAILGGTGSAVGVAVPLTWRDPAHHRARRAGLRHHARCGDLHAERTSLRPPPAHATHAADLPATAFERVAISALTPTPERSLHGRPCRPAARCVRPRLSAIRLSLPSAPTAATSGRRRTEREAPYVHPRPPRASADTSPGSQLPGRA